MNHVRLFLDMSEVLRLFPFVLQTRFMRVKNDVLFRDSTRDILFVGKVYDLRQVM
jgi:hypothetical protein